ncbi:hypothetical protein EYZ11_005087 [Aspergillus tanneri]|uniref:ATP-dependent RNA helicase n=1 Tax=Aspergillus tanneri TaxID=1220188 RepID=A0A4S3JJH7_9EURO|nr:hypothetical protein EYZ11_005087 [Aspergillus tanneri]
MADDGLLLNFSLGSEIIKPETKLKGGTWRDRLSAKKKAQNRGTRGPRKTDGDGNEEKSRPVRNPNHIQVMGARPPKRARTEGEFEAGKSSQTHQQHPGQVISSLFSRNPEPRNAEEVVREGDEMREEAKPSNAPLMDGLDTFTNLGLSATLAAHLLTKMELKAPTAIQKASMLQLLNEESDAFIQAETGSGKTLAYLLPLVQRIMALSRKTTTEEKEGEANVHRDSGLFAIVLAPTRELSGTVIGGEKKKSEKARLRKGLNILVATPGRLADHLENTQVLDVSNVRWLVLDEGDRLMELGFEQELQGIIKKLDARQRPSRIPGVPTKRTTILCSATLKMNVQKLGEISLKDAIHIQADPEDEEGKSSKNDGEESFRVPAQLKQSYAIVAAKLRLVTLTAFLKRTFMRKGSVMKAIVFVTCADSVDFHFEVFTRKQNQEADGEENSSSEKEDNTTKNNQLSPHGTIAYGTAFSNPSNPVTLHKLHGSLPQHVRTSTLASFARSRDPSVLICTDVASRGLDLPNVDLVVEYDPAFSSDDHTHRIGRTARLGRDGRALIFLMPGCEENYVDVLKRGYRDGGKALTRTTAEEIIKRGFGSNVQSESKNWEEKATDWQLEIERWALENPEYLEMARRAYQSHIRAYATHIANERSMFNIKELHLGHLAKSFALRDRPSKINVPGLRPGKEDTKKEFKAERTSASGKKRKAPSGGQNDDADVRSAHDTTTAAQKMRAKMKEHMAGANEFNLA